MKKVIKKGFVRAYDFYPNQMDKFKKFEQDKRISFNEKKILSCWILIRENQNAEVLTQLSPISFDDQLIESQRLLLLGTAYNNLGQADKARPLLEKAVDSLPQNYDEDISRLTYQCQINLFMCYLNLKNIAGMDNCLEAITALKGLGQFEKISIAAIKLCYFNLVGDLDKSAKQIHILNKHAEELSEGQRSVIFLEEFDFYFKKNELANCRKILDKMKNLRKYYLSLNYKFMNATLTYLMNDKALYLYLDQYKDIPFMYHQVMVLLALESKDLNKANLGWSELQKSNPEIYQDHFSYHGDRCLFSVCVEKLRFGLTQEQEVVGNLQENKLLALKELLESSEGLSKETVFKALWGQLPQDKSELNKLQCLVYRLKKQYGIEVISRKGTYSIKRSSSHQKAS